MPEETDSATRGLTLAQLIDSCDAGSLRDFLLEALEDDDALARKFRRQMEPHDVQAAPTNLMSDIDDLCGAYPSYISWRDSGTFEDEYLELVDSYLNPALAARDPTRTLALCTTSLTALAAIEIDDSAGFLTTAIGQVQHALRTALGWSAANREKVFSWMMDFERRGVPRRSGCRRSHYADMLSFERSAVEKLLLEAFGNDASHARDIAALAKERIAAARKAADEDHARGSDLRTGSATFGYYAYEVERWVKVRLGAMRLLGASHGDLLALSSDYLELRAVRQFLVDDALARQDQAEAIRMLEEVQGTSDKATWALPQLAELYRGTGRTGSERKALLTLVVTGAQYARVDHLVRLREMVAKENWPAMRDQVLGKLRRGSSWRRQVLAEEGLMDQLLQDVADYPDRQALDVYGGLLLAYDQERTLAIWHDLLMASARRMGSNRRDYQGFAKEVTHVASLPGGERLRDQVVEEVMALYPRRHALFRELGCE